MTPQQSEALLADVRRNLGRLDACDLHDFEPEQPDNAFSKHRCRKCGGTVQPLYAQWYRRGLEHGRQTP